MTRGQLRISLHPSLCRLSKNKLLPTITASEQLETFQTIDLHLGELSADLRVSLSIFSSVDVARCPSGTRKRSRSDVADLLSLPMRLTTTIKHG